MKYSGAVLEENIWGARQKVEPFLVVTLKTQAKITKSTTPTLVLKKRSLYNCLLVLLLL